jgi:hypothetical protein
MKTLFSGGMRSNVTSVGLRDPFSGSDTTEVSGVPSNANVISVRLSRWLLRVRE